ncbi:MAG TPA: glycosyltransferase family 87 protein [Pseudolabrys sp.]|nr:glycosyltransferase family 87 protein [Pseudolabrys sp.]
MAGFIDILRSGAWLTRERMRLVAIALLAAMVLGAAFLIATSDGLNDRFGRPLGTDFSNVYAAGTYVLDGQPAAPFDPEKQFAREQAIFGQATQFYGWHYPPFFLGVAALLAAMPYWLALIAWQGVTLILYLLAMRAVLNPPPLAVEGGERSSPGGDTSRYGEATPPDSALRAEPPSPFRGGIKNIWLLLALAFPAVFINLGQAHNGFLTAALIGGALTQIDRRPILSGILIGCLAYKPQFGLLIPLVLIASGRWRVFAAAAATVVLLALAVTLAFGPEVWTAFLASTKFTRTVVLEQGDTGWFKIQSVFAWVRMWGGGITLAYAAQGAVTLLIATALVWLWRGAAAFPVKAAALTIGCLLATPYSLDYDLMLLAPAIAYLATDGMTRGFASWEKTILAALWIVPLVARSVPQATLIPLAVPIMLVAFGLLLRRAMNENGAGQACGVLRRVP